MHKTILSLAVAAAVAAPLTASAEPSPVTGNLTIASDYRFRGISQTYLGPAIQGGIDYAHPSGFYVGNWNSNVTSLLFTGGSGIEMDFYAGYKRSFGDIGLDVGTIYYYYPKAEWNSNTGSTTGDADFNNWEIYFGASWRWISAKFFYALSDYFGLANEQAGSLFIHQGSGAPLGGRGGSDGTWYLDLTATVPVNKQVSVVAHYGMLEVENYSELDYKDWKLGVTYDLNGWILGAAYVDSDADENWYYTLGSRGAKETGKSTVVLSVTKTF
ncbi:MAG TPA: TorF family putative porin [Burkholderiaceae bacterium]|nr:TorF family putative porin [Burkholderiaceae bacterium]